ncbi:DUF262 domain-containing protein [Psychrobacter frigidicola]|uniref:DUF262 domain-containing protein n=1 Tax=Psychrobacter frigidicola TaxID=45611 RepID=A0A5C7A3P7_9GAMM|nr:DUF262 domain-containing protein [Psychrobacter frigidicola]TXD98031.1 DUF262 domain-containing protein [Psychrobacter frigidicola]
MKLIEYIDIQPQNTKWLYDLRQKGLLIVDNSFQRNYVWTPSIQIKLIESILIGYPVPEIYLWNIGTDEDNGDTKYSIIDGQQRCGAIFDYISNLYMLKANSLDIKGLKFDEIKNKFFKDLNTEDKKAIWSYIFSIRLVRNNIERPDIVNMFLRLNSNNLTLNPQELRNAEFQGEFMNVASQLSEISFWDKNSIFGVADRRRMKDITFISILLIFLKQGIQEDIINTNINKMYDLYNEVYPSKLDDITKFELVISFVDSIIDGNVERRKFLKSSVHFYTLFTTTFELTMDTKLLTNQQINNYRTFIDNYHSDEELISCFSNIDSVIYKYKALAKEGTSKKNNRMERHNAIKQVMNYPIL